MAKGTSILVLLAVAVVGQALTPSTFFTNVDKERLRSVFKTVKPYDADLESLHYSVLGSSFMGSMELPHEACDTATKKIDVKSLDSIFYASSVKANLAKMKIQCDLKATNAETTLNAAIDKESSTQQLYYAVASLSNLGLKIDTAKVTEALNEALKAEDSPLGHGFAFFAASYLSGDLSKFHDLIEDVIAQADEVDEKFLQFEGGLYTTAIVVDGAYKLATAAKKAPTLTEDKVIKFVNYLLSRKHVQSLKNAATILSVIHTFTDNKFHIPIAVTLASQVSVSDTYPIVQVRVSNLLGSSLTGKVAVTADTARHLGDDAVVLSKKQFSASSNDAALYELDFLKVKPARGFYKISVSVAPEQKDTRLIGTVGAEVEVKVTTKVAIENVELSVVDKDQGGAGKNIKLQHPNKAASVLAADNHQKVVMKFSLRDLAADKPMVAHQTFVRFTYAKTQDEIIYVAEAESGSTYRFELDVGAKAKEFAYRAGKYSMELIVGDAVIQNPFSWKLADVELTFPEGQAASTDKLTRYSKKPEIKHLFREPEKRPAAVVSSVFTALVLAPIAVLVIIWMKLGANIGNFPFSISAMGFHGGLAAICLLYYCYFATLDMFTTLRWLAIIGIPTFLCGHKLLSSIAARRK
jgi:oligosaccharyltransferase complex subunit delta (ribophorin II)